MNYFNVETWNGKKENAKRFEVGLASRGACQAGGLNIKTTFILTFSLEFLGATTSAWSELNVGCSVLNSQI